MAYIWQKCESCIWKPLAKVNAIDIGFCYVLSILPSIRHLWGSYAAAAGKSLQSCLTLCDPIDGSLPGSSVHGIFQAWVLEWVAISFSRGSYENQTIKIQTNYRFFFLEIFLLQEVS